jgi:hypothetical protein
MRSPARDAQRGGVDGFTGLASDRAAMLSVPELPQAVHTRPDGLTAEEAGHACVS